MNHTKPTKGVLLVEDIKSENDFVSTAQTAELRRAKVLAVGDFLYHICGEKIYAEPKVGDIVYFVFNGNEKIPGTNQYLIIFDQLRSYETTNNS
jgi:co-chaperonin GroES (HSP10)